jgi:NitT/TauT family transport system ATP-binding protein
MTMIRLDGLSFKYKSAPTLAIDSLSGEIPSLGIIALVGRSGVGKSTLLALLGGIYVEGDSLVDSLKGEIRIDDSRPSSLRGPDIVSWVPQVSSLLEHLTIHENIVLPTTINSAHCDVDDRCVDIMKRLGIDALGSRRPRQLSGGEKTRVSLARALVTRPRYLFLDEPFASLDLGTRWRIYELIIAERRRTGLTTIMTTHDIPEAMLLAESVVIMARGLKTELELTKAQPGIDLPSRRDCLAEARRRAMEIEERIYLGE